MRVLLIGSGGVGGAIAAITARRTFVELLVVADVDPLRAEGVAAGAAEGGLHCIAEHLDASDAAAIEALARRHRIDAIVNACDPRFNPPIFEAAFRAGCTYLDMAMNLSEPHPLRPYELTGKLLGADQLAVDDVWRARDQLALVGSSSMLRGYTKGRYRDRTLLGAQVEFRAPVYGRFSSVLFAGGGAVAPSPRLLTTASVLPSYGGGLRYAMGQSGGSLIRLDVGLGRDAMGIYVGFQQAF